MERGGGAGSGVWREGDGAGEWRVGAARRVVAPYVGDRQKVRRGRRLRCLAGAVTSGGRGDPPLRGLSRDGVGGGGCGVLWVRYISPPVAARQPPRQRGPWGATPGGVNDVRPLSNG